MNDEILGRIRDFSSKYGHDIAAAGLSFVVIVTCWRAVPSGARFGAIFDLGVILAFAGPWNARLIEAAR